jgi:hypothetical protein
VRSRSEALDSRSHLNPLRRITIFSLANTYDKYHMK